MGARCMVLVLDAFYRLWKEESFLGVRGVSQDRNLGLTVCRVCSGVKSGQKAESTCFTLLRRG